MPTPSSATAISIASARRSTDTVTVPPPGENLTAFATSWSSTCRSLSGSAFARPACRRPRRRTGGHSHAPGAVDHAVHDIHDVGRRERHRQVALVEPRRVEQCIDDRRQPLRLAGDELEERAPLDLREVDVLAKQRLGEAVDRRQRRAQLDGHRRDEVGLHLLELVLGRDVAEREDAAGDRAGRVAHHGLGERQPHVVLARA